MPIKKVCVNCGKHFFVPPTRKESAHFCSSKCKNEKKDWAKTKVERTCEYCGRTFEIWAAWLRKNNFSGKYCSRICKDRAQKRADIPVSNIIKLYQGGLSTIQIGKKMSIPDITIRRRLHEEKIKLRTAAEGITLAYERGETKRQLEHKGRYKDKNGYWIIYLPDYEKANKRGYVREHIYIWEQTTGEMVPKGWVVHHKNEIKDDNRPENLEAMTWANHTKFHNNLRAKELQNVKERIHQLEEENQKLKDLLDKQSNFLH